MTQLWSQDTGLTDVTAAFQGLTAPLHELIDDLHRRGWTLSKLHIKDNEYVAIGKSPHKETLEARGRTEATAVGNLISKVMRREFMRGGSLKQKVGAWNHQPIEQQLSAIAQAYAGAPVYEPKAATAWMELAQDCGRRAQIIRTQLAVEYTNDPVPYDSTDDMREDVTRKRHIYVTRAYAHHPVWSEQQMLDYRLVVDVLGHTIGGADWGWHGTVLAFSALAPMLSEPCQKALYTELLGQAAFGQFYRQWGPQKICFLEDLVGKAQEKENKPGHHPVHPSQSIVPAVLPGIFSRVGSMTPNQQTRSRESLLAKYGPENTKVLHTFPDGWTLHHLPTWAELGREGEMMHHCWGGMGDEGYWDDPYPGREHDTTIAASLRDPNGWPHMSFHIDTADNTPFEFGCHGGGCPEADSPYWDYLKQWAQATGGNFTHPMDEYAGSDSRTSAVVGVPKDPNADWESGVQPLQDNAYLWQRQDGIDPLDIHNATENLRGLETGVANMHPQMAKQAVVNALRSSLLGTRNNARGHAVHYQDLQHLPADVDDPIAFWDMLEQRREAANQAQGYAPGSHKQHWPEEQQFKQWVKASNPSLDDGDVQRLAKRELLHMLTEEEERILAQDQGEEFTAEQIEHEAYEALKRRLKTLTKPNVDQKVDFGDDHLFHEASSGPDVVYHDDIDPRPIGGPPEGYWGRWPTLYDQPAATLHIGPEGTTHSQLRDKTGVTDWRHEGWRGHNPEVDSGHNPEVHNIGGQEYGWYNGSPGPAVNFAMATFNYRHHPDSDQAPDDGGYGHGYRLATHHADMYPPYLSSRMRPLAQIGRNANALTEAAHEDLMQHKGHGHHFRSTALSLGIPHLGPRQLSHAWLHLAPQTSQLGVIEPQLMEALGHDYQNDMSNRNYFKHERELAAGRDAAGYNHVPLGSFSSALWDLKAGGPGWHPDRTPFKAHAPTPHHTIDWNAQTPMLPAWTDPYFWQSTAEARDQAGQDFDRSIGVNFGRDEVPFQRVATRNARGVLPPHQEPGSGDPQGARPPDLRRGDGGPLQAQNQNSLPHPNYGSGLGGVRRAAGGPASAQGSDAGVGRQVRSATGVSPWVTHPETGARVSGAPGTSLMAHLKQTFGHPTAEEVWGQDYEVGKDAGGGATIAKMASDDPVERWVAQGQVLPYAQHDPATQKAIAHYMAIDGEAWPYPDRGLDATLPEYIAQYGHQPFGVTKIPAQELYDAIVAHPDHGPDWERWYEEKEPSFDTDEQRGVPEDSSEIWPVILDREHGEPLQDGWHRAHHYMKHGVDPIPAVWYP